MIDDIVITGRVMKRIVLLILMLGFSGLSAQQNAKKTTALLNVLILLHSKNLMLFWMKLRFKHPVPVLLRFRAILPSLDVKPDITVPYCRRSSWLDSKDK